MPTETAGSHPNDFTERCKFREQILPIGEGIGYGRGETVEVPMRSGRVALYKLTAERVSYVFEDTGQRHWHFKFQGYKDDAPPISGGSADRRG